MITYPSWPILFEIFLFYFHHSFFSLTTSQPQDFCQKFGNLWIDWRLFWEPIMKIYQSYSINTSNLLYISVSVPKRMQLPWELFFVGQALYGGHTFNMKRNKLPIKMLKRLKAVVFRYFEFLSVHINIKNLGGNKKSFSCFCFSFLFLFFLRSSSVFVCLFF